MRNAALVQPVNRINGQSSSERARVQANEAAARILNTGSGEMSAHTFSQVARDYEMAECLRLAQTTRNEQTPPPENSLFL